MSSKHSKSLNRTLPGDLDTDDEDRNMLDHESQRRRKNNKSKRKTTHSKKGRKKNDDDDDIDIDIDIDMENGHSNNSNDNEDSKSERGDSDSGSETESESKVEEINENNAYEMKQGRGRRSRTMTGEQIGKKYEKKLSLWEKEKKRFVKMGMPLNGLNNFRYNEKRRIKVGSLAEILLSRDNWVTGIIHKISYIDDIDQEYEFMTEKQKSSIKKSQTYIVVKFYNKENKVEYKQYKLNSPNLNICSPTEVQNPYNNDYVSKKKEKNKQSDNNKGVSSKKRGKTKRKGSKRQTRTRPKKRSN